METTCERRRQHETLAAAPGRARRPDGHRVAVLVAVALRAAAGAAPDRPACLGPYDSRNLPVNLHVRPTWEVVSELLTYDPSNGELRRKVRTSNRIQVGSLAGSVHSTGYIRVRVCGRTYAAHQLVWLLVYGVWPEKEIDHRNGIRSDNRLVNLRECSRAENHQNRAMRRDNSSGFIGVSWAKREAKWKACIGKGRKLRHLGYFDTAQAAHNAYLTAKNELHTFQPRPRGSNVQSN